MSNEVHRKSLKVNDCVGLFGTCGNSKWRDEFISCFEAQDIPFFNPQVDDWDPSLAQIEAEHLANDRILVWPITSETPGLGSIAETGFSLLQAIRLESRREFVVMVDQTLDQEVHDEFSSDVIKESMRGRALIIEHLKKLQLDNVYLVADLKDALAVTINLWGIYQLRKNMIEPRLMSL